MKHVREFLPDVYRAGAASDERDQDLIFACWDEAVGRAVALHARPTRFSGSCLWVGVDSPEWTAQLEPLKPQIRTALNRTLGRNAVRSIRLGPVAARKIPPQRARSADPLGIRDPLRRLVYQRSKSAPT